MRKAQEILLLDFFGDGINIKQIGAEVSGSGTSAVPLTAEGGNGALARRGAGVATFYFKRKFLLLLHYSLGPRRNWML